MSLNTLKKSKFIGMLTLLFVHGLRFFFYSNENNEPVHVHITKGNAAAKVWLEPIIQPAYLYGFTKSEEKLIGEIVEANHAAFKSKWYEHFSK